MKSDFPMVPIVNSKGETVGPAFRKTSPDRILVQGVLESGATASLVFRKPTASVDEVGFRWVITGTHGEIEATAPDYHFQMDHPDRKLEDHYYRDRQSRGGGLPSRDCPFDRWTRC